ncbi:MAG TPA: hypothetical protein VJU18_08005 [Vicinamibacteria bacterium]|nr:hypothetical protein [Vicinamibacteria bacterium]
MMIRRTVSTALIVALVAALPVPALAQAPAPDTIWGEVPAAIRASNVVGSAALQDTVVDRTIATVPVGADGRFAFSNVPPGQYVVRVLNTNGETVATSLIVTLLASANQRAEFGDDRTPAALPEQKGGINKTVLILAGAAAVGIVAVVALSGDKEPASPSR